MAVASIFARSFVGVTLGNVTDVQQIIDAVRTTLLTTLAVADRWTEPVGNTFLSPADPVSGARMQILLTRASASEIRFNPTDKDGAAIGSGSSYAIPGFTAHVCRFYVGPTHFFMQQGGAGNNDLDFMCVIVDPTPEAMNAANPVVYARANRVFGGGFANQSFESLRCNDGAGGSYLARMSYPEYTGNVAHPNCTILTAGGSELALPVYLSTSPAGTLANNRGTGSIPQCVWVDASHAAATRLDIPLDSGVIGVFEVAAEHPGNSTTPVKAAFRVA